MKSFKTVLSEGRLEENLFHLIIKAHLKKFYKNKKMIYYYDDSIPDVGKTDILGVVTIYTELNKSGDCAYNYEAK